MMPEFNITPSPEEIAQFYSLSACSEVPVPQTCQNCGDSFIARGTYIVYQPNEAGQFTGRQPFTTLLIGANFCENCR